MKIKHYGRACYRFRDNPEEELFAEAWERDNTHPNGGPGTLAYLMGNGSRPGDITQRDATVAATVVQWLGSPIGQCFLRDLGYERSEK